MFGFKLKSVKTKNAYTLEELYNIIKDKPFTAGKPELTRNGFALIITFPPLDRNNQVWILPGFMKKSGSKWTIQKSQVAGAMNQLQNAVLEDLTDGWSGVSSVIGKNAKNIEKLVDNTAQELDSLGL